jgi:hypothetical protein
VINHSSRGTKSKKYKFDANAKCGMFIFIKTIRLKCKYIYLNNKHYIRRLQQRSVTLSLVSDISTVFSNAMYSVNLHSRWREMEHVLPVTNFTRSKDRANRFPGLRAIHDARSGQTESTRTRRAPGLCVYKPPARARALRLPSQPRRDCDRPQTMAPFAATAVVLLSLFCALAAAERSSYVVYLGEHAHSARLGTHGAEELAALESAAADAHYDLLARVLGECVRDRWLAVSSFDY